MYTGAMRSDDLIKCAVTKYAAAIQSGAATAYECKCFFDNWFRYEGENCDELKHKAGLVLVKTDPFFILVSPSGDDLLFTADDIDKCVAAWKLNDPALSSFLEASIRMASVRGPTIDRDNVAKAIVALENAKDNFGSDLKYLELLSEAFRLLDDARYPASCDRLIAATSPEWRAHPLSQAMDAAVKKLDWNRYDELRQEWSRLPKNAHICECNLNFVENIDGLRALDRGDVEVALNHLKTALAVNGCPHLNSGGASLRLAQEFLQQGVEFDAVEAYLQAVEKFCLNDSLTKLKEELTNRRESQT